MSLRVLPALLLLGFICLQLNRINGFFPPLPFTTHTHTNLKSTGPKNNQNVYRKRQRQRHSHLTMAVPAGDGATASANNEISPGKIVAERYIYRFSPTQSSIQTPFTIEERHYFSVGEHNALRPISNKCFIFRKGEDDDTNAGDDMKTRIGPALYTVNGLKDVGNTQGLSQSICDSSLVMALYCMGNPEIVGGKGLELGSGAGVGGILSIIGAGIASESLSDEGYQNADKVYKAPTPAALSEIVFTDPNGDLLLNCLDNIGAASVDVAKTKLRLDRDENVPNDMKHEFNFIIACDCEHNSFPLAKTIASALKSSSYDEFLHIGPQLHESGISKLQHELETGYKMNTMSRDIVLERVHLKPLVMDSSEVATAQMKDETEGKVDGVVEYQRVEMGRFSAVVGCHNEGYTAHNAATFFPAELKAEEENLERASVAKLENSDEVKFQQLADEEKKRVRNVYLKWCEIYRREIDESRFFTFASNFLEMEAYSKQIGETLQFNRWLDCTELECMALNSGISSEDAADEGAWFAAEARKRLVEIADVAEERQKALVEERNRLEAEERERTARIHATYVEWTEVYGKEMSEDKFRTFHANFLAMEAHAAATGKTMLLNQWYDCTQEEHMVAVEAEEAAKADKEAMLASKAVEVAKAEENAKLAAKAKTKIMDTAMKHKKKAVEQARIANDLWKKAEKEAKLAAQVEATARDEDKFILAAENKAIESAGEKAKLVVRNQARLREIAATVEHRCILAAKYKMHTAETERMQNIHNIYLEWCGVYGKQNSQTNFHNFASNFLVMEAFSIESGDPLQLNQCYDYSKDDFIAVTNGKEPPSAIVAKQEDDPDEVREIPQENVEVLEANSSIRQAWYKCTEEEYIALTSGKAEVKIEMVEEEVKEALKYIDAQPTRNAHLPNSPHSNPHLPNNINRVPTQNAYVHTDA